MMWGGTDKIISSHSCGAYTFWYGPPGAGFQETVWQLSRGWGGRVWAVYLHCEVSIARGRR